MQHIYRLFPHHRHYRSQNIFDSGSITTSNIQKSPRPGSDQLVVHGQENPYAVDDALHMHLPQPGPFPDASFSSSVPCPSPSSASRWLLRSGRPYSSDYFGKLDAVPAGTNLPAACAELAAAGGDGVEEVLNKGEGGAKDTRPSNGTGGQRAYIPTCRGLVGLKQVFKDLFNMCPEVSFSN